MVIIPEEKHEKPYGRATKEKEGDRLICKFLQSGDVVVLLDENGKEFRSVEFVLDGEKMANVNKASSFSSWSPYGFSLKYIKLLMKRFYVKKMTFSHQMIRLIFTKQLYRAMNARHGGPLPWITTIVQIVMHHAETCHLFVKMYGQP